MPAAPPRFRPLRFVESGGGERRREHEAAQHRKPTYLEQQRRGSAHSRGYDRQWQKLAASHRSREPLCVCCFAHGITAAAEVVDHIVPHRMDHALRLDPGNLQSLCGVCHNSIKSKLEQLWDAGLISAAELSMARLMPHYRPEMY